MKKLILAALVFTSLGSTISMAYDCSWSGMVNGRRVAYGNNSGHGDCKVATRSYGIVMIKGIK